jgi:toxin ParE1/3/4
MAQTDVLQDHPEIGRTVPEHRSATIREIVFKPYRIVYRVNHAQRMVEIARVWHAARGAPSIA